MIILGSIQHCFTSCAKLISSIPMSFYKLICSLGEGAVTSFLLLLFFLVYKATCSSLVVSSGQNYDVPTCQEALTTQELCCKKSGTTKHPTHLKKIMLRPITPTPTITSMITMTAISPTASSTTTESMSVENNTEAEVLSLSEKEQKLCLSSKNTHTDLICLSHLTLKTTGQYSSLSKHNKTKE